MRRFALPLRLALGLTFALGLSVALAQPAHAGDGDARPAAKRDFVGELTAAERSFVQTKIKGWSGLERGKQQRIAQNVIRMRTMTEAEKTRLQEHIKRIKSKEARRRGARFHDHATRALIGKALAREARKSLGRDFERQLRRRDISEHAFDFSFNMTFWRKVSEQRAASGTPPAPADLPADFPQHWRDHYGKAHAQYVAAAGDAKKQAGLARKLHYKLAMHAGARFWSKVRRMDLKGEAQLDAIAAAIRAEWPAALAESAKDPEALLRGAEKFELRRAVMRLLRRTERLEKEEAAVLVSLLNRLAMHHRKKDDDAAGREASDALLKQVLQRELRVPAEALAGMPSAAEPAARIAWLAALARKAKVHGLAAPASRHAGRGDGRKDGRGGSRRGFAKLEQPEGVSDADWAIYTKARDAAFEAKDFEALRKLRSEKPEGMSDAGYAAVMKALKARMAGWQRGDRKGKGRRKGGNR